MFEFYLPIKSVHLYAVTVSGTLFFCRAIGAIAATSWPRHPLVRYLSWTIDTVLLTAALMLATLLPPAVFSNGWLAAKLTLVVLYILTGAMTLRATASRRTRIVALIASILLFATIVTIAHTHDPRGPWHVLQP
jgi:uncharacterized membrane protein SirB2